MKGLYQKKEPANEVLKNRQPKTKVVQKSLTGTTKKRNSKQPMTTWSAVQLICYQGNANYCNVEMSKFATRQKKILKTHNPKC